MNDITISIDDVIFLSFHWSKVESNVQMHFQSIYTYLGSTIASVVTRLLLKGMEPFMRA